MFNSAFSPARLRSLWRLIEPFVLAVIVTQLLGTLVGVDGASMMPNLRHHERLVVPKYDTWLHKLGVGQFRRGDILVFKPPTDALNRPVLAGPLLGNWRYRPFLVKRLIGLPGDQIRIEKGVVFVNGKALPDNPAAYWRAQGCWDTASPLANQAQSARAGLVADEQELTVPKGEYFVMGDNRTVSGSEDSRLFGPVPLRNIAGRAAAVIWPVLRREMATYDCQANSRPQDHVTFSGKSVLNLRWLRPLAGFGGQR